MSVPSQVTDVPYLRVEVPWVASDSEWRECGKWSLIHVQADLPFVDEAWAALRPLVEDGTLVGLKVSTAADPVKGSVVICYTRAGREEARRSAGAIRRAVDFPHIMHYKLNGQTDHGLANLKGHHNFSLYAHTYCGSFYTRDSCGIWDLNRGDETSVPDASPWCFQGFPESDELPSKSKETHLIKDAEVGPHWYLFCPLTTSRDHQQCLPEADRVWVVARKLYEEGVAKAISWRKKERRTSQLSGSPWVGRYAEIRLYVAQETDVLEWLQFCDRIFEGASTGTFLYYWNGVGTGAGPNTLGRYRDPRYTYKYTCDGELYEKHRFVMRNKNPQL